MKRSVALMVVPLALVAVACGDDDAASPVAQEGTSSTSTTAPASAGEFNDADVAFAQGMIPHHQQAVEMAELAVDRAESPEVKDLASRIQAAQDPEIATMTAWLEEWGQSMDSSMGGMDMGESGMMSEEDMAQLEAASGAEFDRMFLEMMRVHHQSAIEMAQTELENGQNPEALALAQGIIDDQTAEIEEIDQLLAAL